MFMAIQELDTNQPPGMTKISKTVKEVMESIGHITVRMIAGYTGINRETIRCTLVS